MTRRLCLDDSYLRELETEVVASSDGWCRLAATAFHPGGGGQPCDRGQLVGDGDALEIGSVREDATGVWHATARTPELVRTLNVRPPVVDGVVRVIEIAGFDAQACGGTHVHSTGEIGRARLARYWETD